MKLDFSKYSGESDPTYWIRQAEQFFHCHEINYEDQILLVTFHLDGHAQLWYNIMYDDGDIVWEEFCDRVYQHFSPYVLDDYTGISEALAGEGIVSSIRGCVESNLGNIKRAMDYIFCQWAQGQH